MPQFIQFFRNHLALHLGEKGWPLNMSGNSKVADVTTCCCHLKPIIATLNDTFWSPSDPSGSHRKPKVPLLANHWSIVINFSRCGCKSECAYVSMRRLQAYLNNQLAPKAQTDYVVHSQMCSGCIFGLKRLASFGDPIFFEGKGSSKW